MNKNTQSIITSGVMLVWGAIAQTGYSEDAVRAEAGAFSQDANFMKKHTEVLILKKGKSAVAVAPAYQGRVMTSTYDELSGTSFGWGQKAGSLHCFLSLVTNLNFQTGELLLL